MNCDPLHVEEKNGKLLSTNKKVISARIEPPKIKFFEKLYVGR